MMASGVDVETVVAAADEVLDGQGWDADLARAVGAYASDNDSYAAALRFFDAALDDNPTKPELHYDRGVALIRSGDYSSARRAFEQAVALLPHYAAALLNLAWAYLFTEDGLAASMAGARAVTFYANRPPLPENVQYLGDVIDQWMRSDELGLPTMLMEAEDARESGDVSAAHQIWKSIASTAQPGTAGQAIAEEVAATIGFILDLHAQFFAGIAQRREIVPCASALVPSLASSVFIEAGIFKDVGRYCHELVRLLDPEHDAFGNDDYPLMTVQGHSPEGWPTISYHVVGRTQQAGNDSVDIYEITPVGNVIAVRDPAGGVHEFVDYSDASGVFYLR